MQCSAKELSILQSHRKALAEQLAQVDALLASITSQPVAQQVAQPALKTKTVDPEVTARLAVAAEADRILGYWEHTTGSKAPHPLMCSWLTEHGKQAVINVCNQMLEKYLKEKMTERHQVAYVNKVLGESGASRKATAAGKIVI